MHIAHELSDVVTVPPRLGALSETELKSARLKLAQDRELTEGAQTCKYAEKRISANKKEPGR